MGHLAGTGPTPVLDSNRHVAGQAVPPVAVVTERDIAEGIPPVTSLRRAEWPAAQ